MVFFPAIMDSTTSYSPPRMYDNSEVNNNSESIVKLAPTAPTATAAPVTGTGTGTGPNHHHHSGGPNLKVKNLTPLTNAVTGGHHGGHNPTLVQHLLNNAAAVAASH